MRLGEKDDSGRARPVPIDDSEFILPCDNVIAAIGQKPALQDFQEALGLKTTPSDSLWADPVTLQTNVEGMFAGGDCSYQADVIVTAMADGKRAAISIDRQLRGLDMYKERDMEGSFSSDLMVDTSEVANRSKIPLPAIPLEERISFEEVHTGYTKEMAMEEASRCLNCSACCQCQLCASVCEPGAIDYGMRDKVEEVDVGAIILATGFKTFDATRIPRYGYGKYPNVFTSLEIERMVNATGPTGGGVVLKNGETPRSVGIVHCVGSRDNNYNEYCSKVCCMYSLKLAHLIKERTSAKIYNFYIDMRTPGKGYEQFYDQLLSEGTQFIRGRVSDVSDWAVIPEEEGQLVIRAEDTMIGTVRRIPVDMVVLAVGLEPQPDAEDVRRTFNISCSNEGWFLERHPKLAPVSTFTDGITLAGTCQGPKDIPDTVAQAGAAAAEVMALIDVGSMTLEPNTAFIDEENCSGCKTCVPLCPFNAITYNGDGKSGINEALCKGCGTCVAACPSGAAQQMMFTDDQIFEEIIGVLTYA